MRARSSAGLSALLTVIVSLTAPIDSVAFTTAVWPTERWISVCSNFLKPGSSASTRYVPSGSSGARYKPFSFVITIRCVPVSTLVMVTVTPGRTPPDESDTVPSMAPLAACDCASAGTARARQMKMEKIVRIPRVYKQNPRAHLWKPKTSSPRSNSPEWWRSNTRLATYAPVTLRLESPNANR